MLMPMDVVERTLGGLPDDPVMLAASVMVAWLPVCAALLVLLVGAAAIQNHLVRSRRPVPALVFPPVALRPIIGRRTMTGRPRGGGVLGWSRLGLLVSMIVALTALFLTASSSYLLPALTR